MWFLSMYLTRTDPWSVLTVVMNLECNPVCSLRKQLRNKRKLVEKRNENTNHCSRRLFRPRTTERGGALCRLDPTPWDLPSPFRPHTVPGWRGGPRAPWVPTRHISVSWHPVAHRERWFLKQLGTWSCKGGCGKWTAVQNPEAELDGLSTDSFHR